MNNTVKVGAILPALLNPAAAVIGVGLGLLWWLSEDDEDEAAVDPAQGVGPKPVTLIAEQPSAAVKSNKDAKLSIGDEATSASIPEADHKEVIRSAMSELGKRSAAARAKKKAERQQPG